MVPLNRRDASNSRASGSETAQRYVQIKLVEVIYLTVACRAWKNQPTPIDVPSNVRVQLCGLVLSDEFMPWLYMRTEARFDK